jgi:branched-chain amino acid transport system substrate-binding protein
VVSMLTGEPEYLDPLKDETPKGWIVTGYPWDQITTPVHQKFVQAYQKRYGEPPRLGSVVGYTTFMAIAEAIRKAKSTDTEKMVAAFRGLNLETVFGPITFRAIDQQSTFGAFVGKLDLKGDRGIMVDWHYKEGRDYLPPDAVVKQRRPAEAQK